MENKSKIIGLTLLVILVASISLYFIDNSGERISLSPTGVNYISSYIKTSYTGGDNIRGHVNLSLEGAPVDFVLRSNFEGNITLLDFLDANGLDNGEEYNCSSSNCLQGFATQSPINSIGIDGESVYAGFRVTGPSVSITSVNLSIQSNVESSCYNQLRVDVLADGEKKIINNRYTEQTCFSKEYGCFDPGTGLQDATLGNGNEYCEKISLPAGPAYRVGAKIENSTSGKAELKMRMYDKNKIFLGECVLPQHSQSVEELTCNLEYSSPDQGEFFVCARSDGGNYKIKTETSSPTCGTGNLLGGGELTRDYEIFAQSLKFDSFNLPTKRMIVDDALFQNLYQTTLANYMDIYVNDVYERNCQPECVIPIKFSGSDQNLAFYDAEISFNSQGTSITDDKLYSLAIGSPTISSDKLSLDLEEAEFTIPLGSNENSFKFYIDEELVFQKSINISESFSFDVTPKVVAFGQNVLFKAVVSGNITNSTWDFGDGTVERVNGKQVYHRYVESSGDEFDMEVTLTRFDGIKSTRTFTILVGDAEKIANTTLIDYKERLVNLKKNINTFSPWIRDELNTQIDLAGLNLSLKNIETNYLAAASEDDFQAVMLSLLGLNIPIAVNVSERGDSIPLLIGFDNIDVSYIEDISGTNVEDEKALKNSIGAWMSERFNPVISYEEISAFYDDESDAVLSRFRIDTFPKGSVEDTSYLIIGYDVSADGQFMINYGQRIVTGGTYVTLETGQASKSVEFFILGEFSPEELGAYISPEISRLGEFEQVGPCNFNDVCEDEIGENPENCSADCGKGRWGWFIFWIIVLVFIALIIYIVMQEWYKRNYEKHLFKDPNQLYNLVNFIYNARKSGLIDRESRKKLRQSGWSGEQVAYAFKKIDGERLGMYEIPIFKGIENKKVGRELAKRQAGGVVDSRFVRRHF